MMIYLSKIELRIGLSFLVLFFSFGISFSQITLTENDFPSAGDTVRFSVSSTTNNDLNSTGSNFIWDFSTLTADSQFVREFTSIGFSPVQLSFGLFAPVNYQASYFIPENTLQLNQLGNFLPVTLSNARSYQKSLIDSITKVGFSVQVDGIDVAFPSDTIETKYRFPMTFGQNFNSVGYTVVDLNPAANLIIKQHRDVHSVVDGFGQLILPFGSFEVLRVKREIIELDSIYQAFFGTPSWFVPPISTNFEYEWIAQGKKDALLKIIVREINGQQQIQSIEYQDVYLGLDAAVNEIETVVSVSPNPTTDFLNIQSSAMIKSIVIMELNGKILKDFSSVNSLKSVIDISNLTSGFYLVKVNSDKGQQTIRITKN